MLKSLPVEVCELWPFAYEDVPSGDAEGPGSGFQLIGLLSIFDPPRDDTKQTIDDAVSLGLKVKMVTGDQLAIAKETGRRLGLGDNMFASKMPMDLRCVYPEHKYDIVKKLQSLGHMVAMTGDGANDAPALARANVGIAVEGATDAARGAADIVLTEPGLSTIVHAIRQSRIVFQRMRNYSIYACAVTIRIVVALPSWPLLSITYAVAYGLHLALSTILLFVVIVNTTFFEDTFGMSPLKDANDPQLHMIIYLQVAIISQALIFITRSHSWFFMERPSLALVGAFCIAQTVASLLAVFGTMEFSSVQAIPLSWVGVAWAWNLIWFPPWSQHQTPVPAPDEKKHEVPALGYTNRLSLSSAPSTLKPSADPYTANAADFRARLTEVSSAQVVSTSAALKRS
ncbi:plasma membrane H+-ATPase [Puccinia graminis f. sp. tritici]|uniref:Plasma membrane H+-ATPase n=1 Tax=Puccinia graminis f. sp. tritici TaxID=56615 RepID=A0A5B0QE11_PUCGR|nr:plasma membrane H+-ATPase [Puccinia graminis f. sp. tritici]